MQKFKGIKYPFFALKRKPFNIFYSLNDIKVETIKGIFTIDNADLKGDYFSRLIQLEDRISYDYTCRNLQDIIFTKVAWGVDSKGQIYDLSNRVCAPVQYRKVRKIEESLVWVEKISYPFKIYTQEKISVPDELFARLVKVNEEWYLQEFSYTKKANTYCFV